MEKDDLHTLINLHNEYSSRLIKKIRELISSKYVVVKSAIYTDKTYLVHGKVQDVRISSIGAASGLYKILELQGINGQVESIISELTDFMAFDTMEEAILYLNMNDIPYTDLAKTGIC